jgi:hypothetical protein
LNSKCTALRKEYEALRKEYEAFIKKSKVEKQELLQKIKILESKLAKKESEGPLGNRKDKVTCSKGHTLI